VILVALAIVVLGTYLPLMHAAAGGSRWARVLGALEGLLFTAGTGFAGLVAWVWFAMKCDESCDENVVPEARSGNWWHTLDAWQWEAQLALAVVALLASVAAVALPVERRYYAAMGAVIVGLTAFCAWALLVAPLGHNLGI